MEMIPILEEENEELVKSIDDALVEAKTVTITTDEQNQAAGDLLKTFRSLRNEIAAYWDPAIEKAKATKAAAEKTRKDICARKEEQDGPLRKAEEFIKSKMGAYWQEQERERKQEEERLQAEARQYEEDKLLQEAEETGDDSILEEPVIVPQIRVEQTSRVEGVSMQENWKWRVVDPKLIPREYLIIDEKMVNAEVRTKKGKTNIPGIQPYPEPITKVHV